MHGSQYVLTKSDQSELCQDGRGSPGISCPVAAGLNAVNLIPTQQRDPGDSAHGPSLLVGSALAWLRTIPRQGPGQGIRPLGLVGQV